MIRYITNSKYRFFKDKITAVEKSIWELEFKVAKSRQVREGVRQDRDRAVERVQQLEAQLKTLEAGPAKENAQREHDQVADNIKRYEAQMKMVDGQIHGVPAKGEDPGREGILDTIKAYVELRGMYQDYASKI